MENENTTLNFPKMPEDFSIPTTPEESAKLGNMVIYDLNGTIIYESGEQTGGWGDRVYPVGIPYLEIPYGAMKYATQKLERIDVTTEPHKPIFIPIVYEKTTEEKLAEAIEKLKAAGIY